VSIERFLASPIVNDTTGLTTDFDSEVTMSFSTELTQEISHRNLLSHPFYQAWMQGTLTRDDLSRYSLQYSPHVRAFPRFVSAVHSLCENQDARNLLLENLNDEEGSQGRKSHPELWREFAMAFGADTEALKEDDVQEKAKALVDTFFRLCRSSYAEGLGALYAYEYQVPEIAEAKIDGLKRFYGIEDGSATAFFDVHRTADKYHSQACRDLLDQLSLQEQAKAMAAAREAAQALWDFLSEVHHGTCAA
jgi:pyrroloquinoline-quinone synthase